MSYMGMIPTMVDYCAYLANRREQQPLNSGNPGRISILEIGVDRGQTSIPLMHNLTHRGICFDWVGVDIRQDDCLAQQLILMEGLELAQLEGTEPKGKDAHYIIENSLEFLKDDLNVFDLILIDGDHNYDTVKIELSHLDRITHDLSLVICDDYGGRHANTDTFYQTYDSHKDLKDLSTHLDAENNKGGVTRAVNEFIESSRWNIQTFGDEDPAILTRKLTVEITDLMLITDRTSGNVIRHPEGIRHRFGLLESSQSKSEFVNMPAPGSKV